MKKENHSHSPFLWFKRITIGSIILLIGLAAAGCNNQSLSSKEGAIPKLSSPKDFDPQKSVVVYYENDPTQSLNYGITYAIMMRNLLGHFNTRVDLVDVKGYAASQMSQYDNAIYIGGIYDYPLNDDFLRDVLKTSKPFLWINYNIWQLFKKPEWNAEQALGFKYLEVVNTTTLSDIVYKGQNLPHLDTDKEFNVIRVDTGEKCSTNAFIKMAGSSGLINEPYELTCGNFFYMAQNPFANFFASYLVVADALHDFLGTKTQPQLRALVRFEDLTPGNVNYDLLRKEVDTLYQMGVPFSFGVIPVNYDPLGVNGTPGMLIPLHKDFLLQDLITYMISKGGTAVMHGYTHQHTTNSAMDYEFWDGANNRPFPEDGYDWALERVDKGIAEFKEAMGFAPIIWETPHYAASPNTYFAVASRFPVVYERLQVFNSLDIPSVGKSMDYTNVKYITITTPYQLFNSFYGFRVLPENLGYLERGGIPELGFPPTPQGKEQLAQMYKVVRDGVVSFMFHHWQPESDLYDTIQRIQKLGFTFISVQDLLNDVPPAFK